MESNQTNKSKVKKTLGIIGNVLLWMFVAFAVVITILAFTATSSKDGIPAVAGRVISPVLSDSMAPTFNKGDMIFSRKLSDSEKTGLKVMDIITFKADLDGDGKAEVNTHRIVEVQGSGASVTYRTKGDNESFTDPYSVSNVDVISIVNENWSYTAVEESKKTSLNPGTLIRFKADFDEDGEAEEYIQIIVEANKENGQAVSYKTKTISTSNNVEYTVPASSIEATVSESISRIPGLGAVINFLMTPTGFFIVIVIPLILFFLYEVIVFIKKVLELKNAGKKKITAEDEEAIKQRAIEEYIRQQQAAQGGTPDAGVSTEPVIQESDETAGITEEAPEETSADAPEETADEAGSVQAKDTEEN